MGGWKSAIELVPKIGKVMGKAFGEVELKPLSKLPKFLRQK